MPTQKNKSICHDPKLFTLVTKERFHEVVGLNLLVVQGDEWWHRIFKPYSGAVVGHQYTDTTTGHPADHYLSNTTLTETERGAQ